MSPLIDMAKSTIRFYRTATSPLRLMPDFMIIGAQKGGTTSLYFYLIEHPNIVSAARKEPHFFDRNYQKGLSWYRAHFPSSIQKYYIEAIRKRDFITGEASPDYLFHPHAPRRIAQSLPQVKLIALLRNPVDRAYSHYRHQVAHGRETLSFADAIDCEEERTRGEGKKVAADEHYYNYNYDHFSYLARGIYVDQLEIWNRYFSQEQMLVLKSEDLYADPEAIYKRTLEFLNVPYQEPKQPKKEYKQYNKSKETPSKMESALRKRLVEFFEPHNARLYALLGRDFGWN